jgi:diacylglycerol kinase
MKTFKKSVGHATDGIQYVYTHERNFRIHTRIALIITAIGLISGWESWKWGIYILTVFGVLIVEVLNSAIEYTWDHLEPAHHPVVGVIKDVMAGAVLLAVIGSIGIGYILFFC